MSILGRDPIHPEDFHIFLDKAQEAEGHTIIMIDFTTGKAVVDSDVLASDALNTIAELLNVNDEEIEWTKLLS